MEKAGRRLAGAMSAATPELRGGGEPCKLTTMRRFFIWLSVLWLSASLTALAAAADRTAHIDNTTHLLPPIPGDLEVLEAKLADFERRSGFRILVEFHERSPSTREDEVPGAYMHTLAGRLGVAQHGVLLAYFAEESDWRLWIGDDLTPHFAGKPGTVKALTASGAIHDAKEAMMTAARDRAEAGFAALQKSLPGGELPSPDLKLRLQTEALIDALIAKLSPSKAG